MNRNQVFKVNFNQAILFRLIDMIFEAVLVYLYLEYFGKKNYGIFVVLVSTYSWLSLLDFGFMNGIRNILSEYHAKKDLSNINRVLTSGYLMSFLLGTFVLFLGWVFQFTGGMNVFGQEILNLPGIYSIFVLILASFAVSLSLRVILAVLQGFQRSSLVTLVLMIIKIFAALLLVIFKNLLDISILDWLKIYIWINPAILFVASFIVFHYYGLRLNMRNIGFSDLRQITQTGIAFFVLQIGALVLFEMDKFIIINFIGAAAIGEYSVLLKVMNTIVIIYSVAASVIWNLFTDAKVKGDVFWMNQAIEKLRYYRNLSIPIAFILAASYYVVYMKIGGENLHMNFITIILFAILIPLQITNLINTTVLNGMTVLRKQFTPIILSLFANLLVSILLIKVFHFSLTGVVIGTIVALCIHVYFKHRLILRYVIHESNNS